MLKSFTILILFVFISVNCTAQTSKPDSLKRWNRKGKITLLFNQSSFSNWISGGENAVAGNLNFSYVLNYKYKNWSWSNTVNAAYGINDSKTNGTRKTEDRFEWNSIVGLKKDKNWYYSFFLNFQTQFTKGYDYKNDPNGLIPISKAFAPAYINFGPGILYEKSPNFKINLAPATTKLTIVTDDILADKGAFGVDPGKHILTNLGFYASLYFKTTLVENVAIENILNLYSNYLDKPKNIDFDYQLKFIMKVNKYMSTNLNFQAVYNDDAIKRLQFKEIFGIGFNYLL